VRRVSTAFALLLLWTLVILATIRHYSGGDWFGDWLEHFQRTLVFFQHQPAATEQQEQEYQNDDRSYQFPSTSSPRRPPGHSRFYL